MSDARNGLVLEARGVHKYFRQGPKEIRVLQGVDLAVPAPAQHAGQPLGSSEQLTDIENMDMAFL